MAEITLYNYFRSSTSYRVRIALHYKNIPYRYEPIHLLKDGGEQHQSAFLAINPQAEVPALAHNGHHISQSLPIMEYLDEVFPQNPTLPKDPVKRAQVRQFCENINSFMHPLGNLKVLQYLEAKHSYTADDKNKWVQHWTEKGLVALESLAKTHSGEFSFGSQITMADFCLIPQLFTCQRFNADLSKYPKLLEINNRCLQLEAFKTAHPYRQPDTPEELRIN